MAGFAAEIQGLDSAIKHITRKMNRLEDKVKTFSEKLAEIGVTFMNIHFWDVIYDGTPDVNIGNPRWVDESTLEIPVTGQTVAFIEFGTGVHYPDTHPRAADMGAYRGEYPGTELNPGKGLGKNDTWGYYGDPGTNGSVVKETPKGTLVLTHGNPANSVMYNASKEMRTKILETARSVFAND